MPSLPWPEDENDEDVVGVDWTKLTPCPKCNSLEKWWSLTGEERCMKCDFPKQAMKFLNHASNIKKNSAGSFPFNSTE